MIPAGIKKGETEFYLDGNNIRAMHNGVDMALGDLPQNIFVIIDNSMTKEVCTSLDEMQLFSPMDRRIQFLKCNAGSYDFLPDIRPGDQTINTEYVACSQRNICAFEGRLCRHVFINGFKITMAQLKVASLIRHGHYDKEICHLLSIAPDTLRSHKRELQRKLGADRKTQIATQSIKYGIA